MDSWPFAFAGEVIEWRGPAPYLFVAIPAEESEDIKVAATGRPACSKRSASSARTFRSGIRTAWPSSVHAVTGPSSPKRVRVSLRPECRRRIREQCVRNEA